MLDDTLVALAQSLVIITHAMGEGLGKSFFLDPLEELLDLSDLDVQEPVLIVVSETCGEKITSRRPGLLPARHKDERGLVGRHLSDGEICRLRHCEHQGREVGDGVGLDMKLQRHRTHMGAEVVDIMLLGVNPLADIAGIGEGDAEADDPHLQLRLSANVVHPGHDDLVDVAHLTAQHVELISDEQFHGLDVLPPLPLP